MDLFHKLTDEELAGLEQEISDVYERSIGEISEKWLEHMAKVRTRAARAYDKVLNAETDEEKAAAVEDYKRILRNATLQNKHYAEMIDETAKRLSHANEIALDYANGRMPKVYTINYNGSSEGISEAVEGYSFTMCDEGTVRYLINNDKLLLPPKKLDPVKDKAWNTKKLNAEVLQGIIQGESVGKIADRVEKVTEANRVSALRAARTLTTGAENKGRLDSYTNAERMGIKLKKRWMAAMDNRTRHTHRVLDGQMRDNDKPFEVGGRKIMYPGDPDAAPDLVYNCRCTMVAEVDGTSSYPLKPEGKPAWADGLTDEEYEQWKLYGKDGLKEKKRLTRGGKKDIISSITINEISSITINDIFTFEGSDPSKKIDLQQVLDLLKQSDVGREALNHLMERNVKPIIDYTKRACQVRGVQQGSMIRIYMKNISSARVAAQTIIHEATHLYYDIGRNQWAEAVCMAKEKMFLTGKPLTIQEKRYVVGLAKSAYPEFKWKKGGYGYGK